MLLIAESREQVQSARRRQWIISSRKWIEERGTRAIALTPQERKATKERLYQNRPDRQARLY